ncbi:PepSY domain-containing protein [Albidovulum sp.]
MRKLALIAAIAFASPVFATDSATDVAMDSVLGKTIEEVTASLTQMGYEIRKAEMEDGKIEVYFVRDGKMGEVYVDPETGAVVKLKVKS